jgi:hypothetical protein
VKENVAPTGEASEPFDVGLFFANMADDAARDFLLRRFDKAGRKSGRLTIAGVNHVASEQK